MMPFMRASLVRVCMPLKFKTRICANLYESWKTCRRQDSAKAEQLIAWSRTKGLRKGFNKGLKD